MNRRSETKQEAGRAALLPPALTSPHGARRLYLGTATVCGAAAPLGHSAECRFSRQQTTTAPSKPLEAAAPRPVHRCFDSHSPATTAPSLPHAGNPAGILAGEGGRREGQPHPRWSSSSHSPPRAVFPGDGRASIPKGLPEKCGGHPAMRKLEQGRGGSPHRHPTPAMRPLPGQSPQGRSVRTQHRRGAAPRAAWGSPARHPALFTAHVSHQHVAPKATQRLNLGHALMKGNGELRNARPLPSPFLNYTNLSSANTAPAPRQGRHTHHHQRPREDERV